MRKRHVKWMAAGALSAAMVIANLPMIQTQASGVTGTVNITELTSNTSNVSIDKENGATTYTVTADGTYEFTGSNQNVAIVVGERVNATLVLNNLTIDDSTLGNNEESDITDIIFSDKKSVMSIVLEGESTLLSNPDNSNLESAIKHKKNNSNTISIEGTGSLRISGTSDDAIKYKGGTISISSGDITIENCYGDGIQAENVYVSGGNLDISTTYENASTGYYGTSKANNITESGSTKTEIVTVDTGSHKGIKAGTKAKSYKYTSVADGSSNVAGTTYTQAASGGLYISGGTINVDTTAAGLKANGLSSSGSYTKTSSGVYIIGSPDDGLHSNNELSITGGTVNIAAGDDGITAAEGLTITGTPDINITEAYEGIEGAAIVIGTSGSSTGPDIDIVSADDGINAAHKTVSYVYADEDEEQYTKTSVSGGGNTCTIYSGNVTIDINSTGTKTTSLAGKSISYTSSGDGIDCNGSLDIEGGTTIVYGQSSGDNSPIDTDSGFTLGNGATVLAAGCDSMGESAPKSGSGVYLTYGSSGNMGGRGAFGGSSSIAAGSTFKVLSGSATIYSGTLKNAASYVLFASPSLSSGKSYSLTIGSNTSTATAVSAGSGTSAQSYAGMTNQWSAPDVTGSNTQSSLSYGPDSSTGSSSGGSSGGGGGSSIAATTGSTTTDTTTATTDTTTTTSVETGDTVTDTDSNGNEVSYTVTGSSTVSYDISETSGKKVVIPDTVEIDGNTYKVTRIAAGALKGNDEITKVVIGENVKVIGAKAFANCENLKVVTIDGSTLKRIGKKAFKGISKNAKIKVSGTTKQVKAVKKLIKASGIASTVKVKKA